MRLQNPMLIRRVVPRLTVAIALFAISPAVADDKETCTGSLKSDVAITACTRAIASAQNTPQNQATLYTSRGIAYAASGQWDRASQDFDEALRLDPQFTQGDNTDPVAIGDGRFIFCCRAALLDCRDKTILTIRNIPKQCIEACSRTLSNKC